MLRGRTQKGIWLLVCSVGSLLAQEFRATLTGRLTDATGAGVPNATITANNVATNVEVTGTTSDDGNYTIPFLQPGTTYA